MPKITRPFFERDTVVVARALLGQRLVRLSDGRRVSGLICETEAYLGPSDPASHAFRRTPRSAVMYGPAGHAYVYFIYGSHFCLNVVTEPEGQPGAVLLRALVPAEGVEAMQARRGSAPGRRLADGPGKLCQALAIDRTLNGADLVSGEELWIEEAPGVPDAAVVTTARIGVGGDEATRARPWRFVWEPAGPG